MDLEGFPGRLWLEGRTPLRLHAEAPLPGPMPRGPAERTGTGFLNAAMAPARTRSILLLEDALARGWLVDDTTKPIRILDGLASTGVRWRRWLHELPSNLLPRLRITANDLDGQALDWARATHAMHPPNTSSSFLQEEDRWGTMSHGEVVGGVRILREDLRQVLAREAFQWIDLDPFGSPMPFLDGAIQAIGRRGVLAVTATDTAALCGSSWDAGRRRYGAQGVVDEWRHDTAVRILLGAIARIAAQHDRIIEPVLAMFDGHHVRVTVRILRSKSAASQVHASLGWRCHHRSGPPTFHPWDRPPEHLNRSSVSGPLWTGALGAPEVLQHLTSERVIERCMLPEGNPIITELGLEPSDLDAMRREHLRSVAHIAPAAELLGEPGRVPLPMDLLPRWFGVPATPRLNDLVDGLQASGRRAARAPMMAPMVLTDASLDEVGSIVRELVQL